MLTTIKRLRSSLTPKFGSGEAEAIIRLIFHHLKGWNTVDMIINENKKLSPYILEKINEIEERLLNDEPIQYIAETAYFYGMELYVNPDVLIPRPETEELIDIIVRENKKADLNVLDACTGSGCISIALSRNLLFPHITDIDISEGALEVARKNIVNLKIQNISLVKGDIFTFNPSPESLDIIVSNPPYVCEHEKEQMSPNVLEYEPARALFVPDNDPLRFYKRIAEIGIEGLRDGGKLYFETNPLTVELLKDELVRMGYKEIEILLDIHGRKRFLKCRKG